jgi:hypothetical protein
MSVRRDRIPVQARGADRRTHERELTMTWKAFHNRGETLRAVIAAANARRDGELPTDVEGVAELFRDELDLLGALQLKWHTRLSGYIERELASQPLDLEHAVAVAWGRAADELGGVRLVLDNYRAHPVDYAMAGAMMKATAKEHQLLAVTAGRAGLGSPDADLAAARIGAQIEEYARELHRGSSVLAAADAPRRRTTLIDRLRAVMAA